jgi:hypothetical protein
MIIALVGPDPQGSRVVSNPSDRRGAPGAAHVGNPSEETDFMAGVVGLEL